MVYDCFTFLNEFDILDARIHELWDAVDYFVITEANKTHQGMPKPYIFESDLKRFEYAIAKIIYIKHELIFTNNPGFPLENDHRRSIMKGLINAQPNDIIMISDVDEIPTNKSIKEAINLVNQTNKNVSIMIRHFHFYLNVTVNSISCGPVINFYKNIKDPQYQRDIRHNSPHNVVGGWHLSWLGGKESILQKLTSYCHIENNNEQGYYNRLSDYNNALNNFTNETDDINNYMYGIPDMSRIKYCLIPFDPELMPQYIVQNMNIYDKYIYHDYPII